MDQTVPSTASTKEDLSKKLKQKMSAQRLKRSSTVQKKTFLEKQHIPTEMMDKCITAMNHQSAPNLIQLMSQISTMANQQGPAQARMAPPSSIPTMSETTEPEIPEVVPELIQTSPLE